jgi:glycerol uptake facilitator-like aquaporin
VLASQWRDHWVWWLGPGLGCLFSVLVYRVFFTTTIVELSPILGT